MIDNPSLTDSVLWIDREARIRRAIESLFTSHDIEVITARSSGEGLAHARVQLPKLIVVHNLAPRLEYYAILAELRACAPLQGAFVFVADDPAAEGDASDLLAFGADATIERPIDPDLVMEVVAHVFADRLTSQPAPPAPARRIRYRRD